MQTRRIVGIDLNQEYLDIARDRFAHRLRGLELLCLDIADCELEGHSVDLIYAGLVLEYVDPATVLDKASRWLRPGGVFATVLQLPSENHGKVSETGFPSLRRLEGIMDLIDPQRLKQLARRFRFGEAASRTETLMSGKQFFIGTFRLEA